MVYLLPIYVNINSAFTDFWKDYFSLVIECENFLHFFSCSPVHQWLPPWRRTVSSRSFGICTLPILMFIKYVPIMSFVHLLCNLNTSDNISLTLVVFAVCNHADYPSWDNFYLCLCIWNGLSENEPSMGRHCLAIPWHISSFWLFPSIG